MKRVAPGAEPAADGLAREDLQALASSRDARRPGRSAGRCARRRSATARRSDSLLCTAAVESCLPPLTMTPSAVSSTTCRAISSSSGTCALLVLRLRAAVDLRVAQRVGEEEVVVAAVLVVVDDVLAEVALRVLERAEDLGARHQVADVRRQDVGAAAELAPGQHVPELAVAPLAVRVLVVLGQQPGEAGADAVLRRRRRSSRRGTGRCSAGRRRGPAPGPCP